MTGPSEDMESSDNIPSAVATKDAPDRDALHTSDRDSEFGGLRLLDTNDGEQQQQRQASVQPDTTPGSAKRPRQQTSSESSQKSASPPHNTGKEPRYGTTKLPASQFLAPDGSHIGISGRKVKQKKRPRVSGAFDPPAWSEWSSSFQVDLSAKGEAVTVSQNTLSEDLQQSRCDRCTERNHRTCEIPVGSRACSTCAKSKVKCRFSMSISTELRESGQGELEEEVPRCDRCVELGLECKVRKGTKPGWACSACKKAKALCTLSKILPQAEADAGISQAETGKGISQDLHEKKCDRCAKMGRVCHTEIGKLVCSACTKSKVKCSFSVRVSAKFKQPGLGELKEESSKCGRCAKKGLTCQVEIGYEACSACAKSKLKCSFSARTITRLKQSGQSKERDVDSRCQSCTKNATPCWSDGNRACTSCAEQNTPCTFVTTGGSLRTFHHTTSRTLIMKDIMRYHQDGPQNIARRELRAMNSQALLARLNALTSMETGILHTSMYSFSLPHRIDYDSTGRPAYDALESNILARLIRRRFDGGLQLLTKRTLVRMLHDKDAAFDFTMIPRQADTGFTRFISPPGSFAEYLKQQDPNWSGFVMADDDDWENRMNIAQADVHVQSPFGSIEVALHPNGRANYAELQGKTLYQYAFNRGLQFRLPAGKSIGRTPRPRLLRFLEEQDNNENSTIEALRYSQHHPVVTPLNYMGDEIAMASLTHLIQGRGYTPQPTSGQGHLCGSRAMATSINGLRLGWPELLDPLLDPRLLIGQQMIVTAEEIQALLFESQSSVDPRYGVPTPALVHYLNTRNPPVPSDRRPDYYVYSNWSDEQFVAALELLIPRLNRHLRLGIVLQQHTANDTVIPASAYVLGNEDPDAEILWVTNDGHAFARGAHAAILEEGDFASHWEGFGPLENDRGRHLVRTWGFGELPEESIEFRRAPRIFRYLREHAEVVDLDVESSPESTALEADEEQSDERNPHPTGRNSHLIRCIHCDTAFQYTDQLWGHLKAQHPNMLTSDGYENDDDYVSIAEEGSEGEDDLEHENYEAPEDIGDDEFQWYLDHRNVFAKGVKLRPTSRVCIPCREGQTKEHPCDLKSPCSNCTASALDCVYPDYNLPRQTHVIFKTANLVTRADLQAHLGPRWEMDDLDKKRGEGGLADPEPQTPYYFVYTCGRISSGDVDAQQRIINSAPLVSRKHLAFMQQPQPNHQLPDSVEPLGLVRRDGYLAIARNSTRHLPTTLSVILDAFPSLRNFVQTWSPDSMDGVLRLNNPNPPREVHFVLRGAAGCTVGIEGFGDYRRGFFNLVWSLNQALAEEIYLFFYLEPTVVDGTARDSIDPGVDYTREPRFFHGFEGKCFGKFNLKKLIDRESYNNSCAVAQANGLPQPVAPVIANPHPVYDNNQRNDLILRMLRDEYNFRVPNYSANTVPTMAIMRARNKGRNRA